jgi:hypothetical protein
MINVEDFKDPKYLMDYYLSTNSRIAALELAVKKLTVLNTASDEIFRAEHCQLSRDGGVCSNVNCSTGCGYYRDKLSPTYRTLAETTGARNEL